MKQITKQMCTWIESSIKNWEPGNWNKQDNTGVYRHNNYTTVKLFGNCIASIEQPNAETDIYHSDIICTQAGALLQPSIVLMVSYLCLLTQDSTTMMDIGG